MNTTVTVTGLQITAKSDTTYLLISRANTLGTAPANAAAIQAENSGLGFTSVAVEGSSAVFPVAPASAVTEGSSGTHTNLTGSGANPANLYWYTMVGTDPTSSGYVGIEHSEKNVTAIVNSDSTTYVSDYVLKKTFYFTIANGANNAANLMVDTITFTDSDPAVRCLVVGTNGYEIFSTTGTGTTVFENTLNSTTVYKVDVYVYYDGNASTIYTNNLAILKGDINITFKVTAAG